MDLLLVERPRQLSNRFILLLRLFDFLSDQRLHLIDREAQLRDICGGDDWVHEDVVTYHIIHPEGNPMVDLNPIRTPLPLGIQAATEQTMAPRAAARGWDQCMQHPSQSIAEAISRTGDHRNTHRAPAIRRAAWCTLPIWMFPGGYCVDRKGSGQNRGRERTLLLGLPKNDDFKYGENSGLMQHTLDGGLLKHRNT